MCKPLHPCAFDLCMLEHMTDIDPLDVPDAGLVALEVEQEVGATTERVVGNAIHPSNVAKNVFIRRVPVLRKAEAPFPIQRSP